jgi:hypothetical protein
VNDPAPLTTSPSPVAAPVAAPAPAPTPTHSFYFSQKAWDGAGTKVPRCYFKGQPYTRACAYGQTPPANSGSLLGSGVSADTTVGKA